MQNCKSYIGYPQAILYNDVARYETFMEETMKCGLFQRSQNIVSVLKQVFLYISMVNYSSHKV